MPAWWLTGTGGGGALLDGVQFSAGGGALLATAPLCLLLLLPATAVARAEVPVLCCAVLASPAHSKIKALMCYPCWHATMQACGACTWNHVVSRSHAWS